MKFFIDSADIKEIQSASAMGMVDGVTTNPSLVAKTGQKFTTILEKICEIVDGPISAEVVSTETAGMLREGKELAKIHKNIVIKVPLTIDGLKATKEFSAQGIRTNVTLCFSAVQALLAAKAGAAFISPFLGRLDDIASHGMELIQDIRTIYDNYGFETEILAASIRSPLHVRNAALIGADVATIPYSTIVMLAKHPLTDIGLDKFLKDWEKAQK